MLFITYVICNLCQVVIGVLAVVWILMLMAFLGQGIIDVSNHAFESGTIFLVGLVLTPWFFRLLGKAWNRLAGWKQQQLV